MLMWLGAATIKSTQARKPTFGFQVYSRLEAFRGPLKWEGWDLPGKVLMGLDETKTAFCQHVCPQIHYLEMRALLCNVRRKELATPYRDSLISIFSLRFFSEMSTAHGEKQFPSTQISENKVGILPWTWSNKGERQFHQTRNLTSASNKCLLARRGRASRWQTRIEAPDGFLKIFPLLGRLQML